MGAFWKTLWGALVSVGGIVALFITARAEELLWAFWVTFSVALVIAVFWTIGPRAFKWIQYVRDYPALLKRAGQLQKENEDLKSESGSLETAAAESFEDGIRHGEARVIGALKALEAQSPLVITAADLVDGKVLLAAECRSQVLEGAWFVVESSVQGVEKGIVEVVEYDSISGTVVLSCVEPTVPKFWGSLAERAESDPSPPHGMRLVPFALPLAPLPQRTTQLLSDGVNETTVTALSEEVG